MKRAASVVLCTIACIAAAAQQRPSSKTGRPSSESSPLASEISFVTAHISANSLRGHVAFLASDLLEGRDTPSRGLDIAAEYIASDFRRMGLEPANGASYFQPVPFPTNRSIANNIQGSANNVAGILRGSDPALRDTYVILSAHYDHEGIDKKAADDPNVDRIFNGANDDASGTASVLEIAGDLASLPTHPARSVLVILFCGEEKGLVGSRFYAAHPLVPLAKTIAQINLEQMGRTDSPEGAHLNMMNVTGFDYSSIPALLTNAGRRVKVAVVKDPQASEAYFRRSDNGPLADAGIPAHTISVTYEFPDYHAVGDEWQKLDYDNMARVDRAVALAMLRLASAIAPPKWNDTIPAVKRFEEAAKKLRP